MNTQVSTIITIDHPAGLHARPAARFVTLAARFPCSITVRKLNGSKPSVNAKSALSVLTLAVNQGDTVEIVAQGDQAQEAISALVALIRHNFEESTTSHS